MPLLIMMMLILPGRLILLIPLLGPLRQHVVGIKLDILQSRISTFILFDLCGGYLVESLCVLGHAVEIILLTNEVLFKERYWTNLFPFLNIRCIGRPLLHLLRTLRTILLRWLRLLLYRHRCHEIKRTTANVGSPSSSALILSHRLLFAVKLQRTEIGNIDLQRVSFVLLRFSGELFLCIDDLVSLFDNPV